jgi:hypothetical protein
MKTTNYITVGCDIRKLAAIHNMLEAEGMSPHSISKIVGACIDLVYANAVPQSTKDAFVSAQVAADYLQKKGYAVQQMAEERKDVGTIESIGKDITFDITLKEKKTADRAAEILNMLQEGAKDED